MIAIPAESLTDLYEADETAWLDAMAELMRERRLNELDYANLQEHLEAMALRDRKKVESRLAILMAHVLKWHYQHDQRTPSWRGTIIEQRHKLTKMTESGSLRKHAESVLTTCYGEAVEMAMEETNLPSATFPAECPWTLEQILSAEVMGDDD